MSPFKKTVPVLKDSIEFEGGILVLYLLTDGRIYVEKDC